MGLGFKTVKESAGAELVVKKSHFTAYVCRAADEEDARKIIERTGSENRDASHNAYAYIVGEGSVTERYSDDGEPNGTAGIPILEKIRHFGLTDTVVVVTRYFGGTKLGTGGLARAYGGCAEKALEKAGAVLLVPGYIVSLAVDYHYHGKIENYLSLNGFCISDEIYSDHVIINTLIPKEEFNEAMAAIAELTNARAEADVVSEKYIETEI